MLSEVVKKGGRPERPKNLLDDHKVWSVVKRCWFDRSESRPSSSHVVDLLNSTNIDASPTLDGKESLASLHTFNSDGLLVNGIDTGVFAHGSPVENSWNWNSGVTAINSLGSGGHSSQRLPWKQCWLVNDESN